MTEPVRPGDIYRLAAWLSPAFPVGAYTYSSGLEYAIEAGLVTDAIALETWLADMLRFGAGRSEGGFFAVAYRAARDGDETAVRQVLEWADALRPTAELALESAEQGDAFLKTVRSAWPHDGLDHLAELAREAGRKPGYAVSVGAACGFHGLPLGPALAAFLHAIAANLISAAVRSVPLGQTDGQRVTAALEPVIANEISGLVETELADIGSATPVVDWASMRHETQYTRLFRS